MTASPELSPAAVVAASRPALLRTALLLTGDPAGAEALVQEALGRSHRAWSRPRSGDPDLAVLRALVGTHTGWRGRLHREQVLIDSATDDARPAGQDLARALRELPARTRAVLVLRFWCGLSPEATADLTRLPVAAVAAAADRGLTALGHLLGPSPYARPGVPTSPEQRLREELSALADGPVRWQLSAEEAADDARRRARARPRRAAATAGAVALLCTAAVVVPLTRSAPEPAAQAVPRPAVTEAAPRPSVPVLAGPTRGSLAGDQAFLDAVRRVGWGAQDPPPVDRRDVVLATDTPDGRAVLLVGVVDEDVRGVWLTGPVGAAAGDLVPHLPRGLGRDRPLTVVLGGPGPATLVVVTAPGDGVEVSDRVRTGPLGTVSRGYEPVPTVDGIAVTAVQTTADGTGTSIRVVRDGQVVHRSGVDWPGDRPGRGTVAGEMTPLRPGPAEPDPALVTAALTAVAVPLAVEPAALAPELLWSAPLPDEGRPGSVVVVVGRSPGGAYVVATWAGRAGALAACGVSTPPGNTDVAGITVARVCSVPDPGRRVEDDERWLVVSASQAAVRAEVLDGREGVRGTVDLVGGGAVLALPERARTVRTLDAAGRQLAVVPVAPLAPEPFGDYGTGTQD